MATRFEVGRMRRFVQTFVVVAAVVVPAGAHAAGTPKGTVHIAAATPIMSDLLIDAAPAQPTAVAARDLCEGHRAEPVMCGPGNGRRTRGGGNKVSHLGWPAVTGILWIVREATKGQSDTGTEYNDELLGSHGGDTISGGPGDDILWGDQLPTGNNTWQHDVIDGGAGDDWIYSSHGHNDIKGGAGTDHIWGHFGHGTIDCGPGWDVVHTKHRSTYKLRHCERHLTH
jgi:hypothetical protein